MNRRSSVSAPTDRNSLSRNVCEVAAALLILTTTYAGSFTALKVAVALGWYVS